MRKSCENAGLLLRAQPRNELGCASQNRTGPELERETTRKPTICRMIKKKAAPSWLLEDWHRIRPINRKAWPSCNRCEHRCLGDNRPVCPGLCANPDNRCLRCFFYEMTTMLGPLARPQVTSGGCLLAVEWHITSHPRASMLQAGLAALTKDPERTTI